MYSVVGWDCREGKEGRGGDSPFHSQSQFHVWRHAENSLLFSLLIKLYGMTIQIKPLQHSTICFSIFYKMKFGKFLEFRFLLLSVLV